ncbi:hypothetical protein [Cerasicoccus maritimus]|uniref:hypothetical protein n=1 Tax=Cerasicoccus maritimus TaxID=490089 RepID=UPI00285249C1|nr:hypothetical protein [Cerasicoccus maritimus]
MWLSGWWLFFYSHRFQLQLDDLELRYALARLMSFGSALLLGLLRRKSAKHSFVNRRGVFFMRALNDFVPAFFRRPRNKLRAVYIGAWEAIPKLKI